jgi:dipeptidyl aminopeptidase/acylaminoacyl peptidase
MRRQLAPEVYERAERLRLSNRAKLVPGAKVRPRWLEGGTRFWYRAGEEIVLVDPSARTRTVLDAEPVAAPRVPPDPLEVSSPDGRRSVVRRGWNLSLRSLETGDEQPLTTDGVEGYSYGNQADALGYGVLMRRFGLPHLPPMVAWSPDSTRVLTHRTDQRGLQLQHLVEAVPPDGGRPALTTARLAMPGDESPALAELIVFDVETGGAVRARGEPLLMPLHSPVFWKRAWWAADGSAVFYVEQSRDVRTLRLKRLDPGTGDVRTLVEERAEPRAEPSQLLLHTPTVAVLSSGDVLWFSQRDGWGHLYVHSGVTGEAHHQVTSGEFVVQQILRVDEDEQVAYVIVSGLVADDPYRRQVCRVGLDGSGFTRLGDDDLDHTVLVPDAGTYYVDSASTVADPPVTTVRAWDGRVLVELERADASLLRAAGWTPPTRFRTTAADGEIDVYGALYLPPDLDPSQRYPVLDHIYPGPHLTRVAPSFEQLSMFDDTESIAALGFVVVAIDGRGTPARSKAFHDVSHGRLGDAGSLDDHVAAIRQLAETRPWLDLDRVGIFGLSAGGFATVRALCTRPDFYKVGVAENGNHDQRIYHLGWGETYVGPFDERVYAGSSNPDVAHQLEGKLLLIVGEQDDNVYPQHTLRVVERLIAADKDFDLIVVPGAEHFFVGYEYYVRRRKWDFLVRNLLGAEPPPGYRLGRTEMDFETFAELM